MLANRFATAAGLTILAGTVLTAAAATLPEPPRAGSRVLLVTGNDYPGHHWKKTAPALASLLGQDARLHVRVTEDPAALASPKLLDWDVIVLHFMNWESPSPGPEARTNLLRFVLAGKGLALVHFACGAWQDWPEFKDLVGRVWDPKLRGHDPHGRFDVEITDPEHPITRGLKSFETTDELYTCLTGDRPIHVLAAARSKVDGKDYPMAFVLEHGRGRVFHTVLGHDARALTNSTVPELLRRGCAWAAGLAPRLTFQLDVPAAGPMRARIALLNDSPLRNSLDQLGVREISADGTRGPAVPAQREAEASPGNKIVICWNAQTNPGCPGDWINFAEIKWLQPTFPTAGTRFLLKKEQPLVLRDRLWLSESTAFNPNELSALWRAYQSSLH